MALFRENREKIMDRQPQQGKYLLIIWQNQLPSYTYESDSPARLQNLGVVAQASSPFLSARAGKTGPPGGAHYFSYHPGD